jgi:NitT/TauT family transport system substrate-binding protein
LWGDTPRYIGTVSSVCDVFVVTETTYDEKKDILIDFIKGYQNSAEWMINQPEEAAALAVEKAIDGKDEKRNLEIIQLRNQSSMSKATQEKGLGTLETDVMQQGANIYKQLGLIQKEMNMSDVISAELMPEN